MFCFDIFAFNSFYCNYSLMFDEQLKTVKTVKVFLLKNLVKIYNFDFSK